MPEAIRTVNFTVTEKSLTPSTPQWAGIQGEHQATCVQFTVPAAWTAAGYRFRVEWVDGMQGFFTSGWLTAVGNKIRWLLPGAWTAAGGSGEIRLAAYLEGESDDERQTMYSAVGRLTFSARDANTPAVTATENALSFLLSDLESIRGAAVSTQTAAGGKVVFDGKIAMVYGVVPVPSNEEATVELPCAFERMLFLSVNNGLRTEAIEVMSDHSFTIAAAVPYRDIAYLAVGTLKKTDE